ncbi:hypothetical protein K3495_g13614, partial [Podosphaera aphanis]
ESNKPVAVATPVIPFISPRANNSVHATPLRQHTLPQKPQLNGSTWATVARKGLKKARIDLQNSQLSVIPPNNFKKTAVAKHADGTNAAASQDPRLFVRLSREHEWRKLSPAGLRELVVKRLSISPTLIGKIKPVNSGFALSPSSSSAKDELLKAENGLFLSGTKLEAASNWVQLLIPTVPTTISRLDDRLEVTRLEVTKTMLMDEIERVTSVRPVTVKLFGYQRFGAPHRIWMAFFSKAPRPGFRVFDESGMAANFKKQRAIDFWDREFQLLVRVKAAESKAAAAMEAAAASTSSQDSISTSTTENIQASPAEEEAVNVRRGGTTHDIALARACELQLDILLIQEPWWSVQKFPSSTPTGDYCWAVVSGITFLNVYKAPHDPSAVEPLLNWTPDPKSVAIGDFSSVHWAWQPCAARTYGQGEEIEKWAEDHNLTCLIVGEPTHRAENTLDLAWTNIDESSAWVDREECMTSDHLPICGSIFSHNQQRSAKKGPLRVSKENLPQFAKVVSEWLPPLPSLDSVEQIENFAQGICRALKDALKAVGKRRNKASGRAAPWWTLDCKEAHLQY